MEPTNQIDDNVHVSDHSLVDAVVSGEKSAFEELIHRYERVVQAKAVAILRDRHLAQDAVQETFLQAYKHLTELRDRSRFGSWVITIARRQASLLIRRRDHTGISLEASEVQSDAKGRMRLDDDFSALLDAIERLPEHELVVVVLHYFQGYKVELIGQMTGRSTGTVTKQLTRARNKLKQLLQEKE